MVLYFKRDINNHLWLLYCDSLKFENEGIGRPLKLPIANRLRRNTAQWRNHWAIMTEKSLKKPHASVNKGVGRHFKPTKAKGPSFSSAKVERHLDEFGSNITNALHCGSCYEPLSKSAAIRIRLGTLVKLHELHTHRRTITRFNLDFSTLQLSSSDDDQEQDDQELGEHYDDQERNSQEQDDQQHLDDGGYVNADSRRVANVDGEQDVDAEGDRDANVDGRDDGDADDDQPSITITTMSEENENSITIAGEADQHEDRYSDDTEHGRPDIVHEWADGGQLPDLDLDNLTPAESIEDFFSHNNTHFAGAASGWGTPMTVSSSCVTPIPDSVPPSIQRIFPAMTLSQYDSVRNTRNFTSRRVEMCATCADFEVRRQERISDVLDEHEGEAAARDILRRGTSSDTRSSSHRVIERQASTLLRSHFHPIPQPMHLTPRLMQVPNTIDTVTRLYSPTNVTKANTILERPRSAQLAPRNTRNSEKLSHYLPASTGKLYSRNRKPQLRRIDHDVMARRQPGPAVILKPKSRLDRTAPKKNKSLAKMTSKASKQSHERLKERLYAQLEKDSSVVSNGTPRTQTAFTRLRTIVF
jgi:hypothetical protein